MPQSSQPLSSITGSLRVVGAKSVHSSIFRALLSISSAALLIRVFGMLNQVVITSHFGASATMDAYFVAASFPTLLGQLAVSSTEASVIPVYARIRKEQTKERVSILLSTLVNLLLIGTVLVMLLLFIFRGQMIFISAPALDATRAGYAAYLAPFILPSLLLTVVIGFLECILNSEGQFGLPAYAGLLVPLVTALFVLFIGKSLGVVTLAIGMVCGLCVQLVIFLWRIRRVGVHYRPVIHLRSPEIGLILIAAWPVFLGALISQAGPLVDQMFASFLSPGSISALAYALKLIGVPTGVIFVSVGRAALPYLSRQAAANDMEAFKETLHFYLWVVGLATAALSVFMIVLAHPIVQILFERGAFTVQDTSNTANTMIGFAVGLLPMSLGFIFARAFSALGKTRVLMYVTTFSVVANAVFDYIFARLWQNVGIALSTSAVYFCTLFILFLTLRHMIGKLYLSRPPDALLHTPWMSSLGAIYTRWVGPMRPLFLPRHFSYHLHGPGKQLLRLGLILAVFAAGVTGMFFDALYTLRISLGTLIVLAFLRYRYILLFAWVLLDALIGSPLPFFNGNNLVSGLLLPLLLLMTCMPLKQTFRRMPALTFLLIFLLWIFASIGISAIGVGAFLTLWSIYLGYVALSVLTINVLTTERRLMGLIDAILLISLFVALYGLYGFFTEQNGIADPVVRFRIFSVFGSAPTLSMFCSIVIPLAFYRFLILRGFKRVVALLVMLANLAALGLTFTRSTLITVPLSIIVVVFFLPWRKTKRRLLGTLVALGALAFLFIQINNIPLLSRFFQQDIGTLNGRTYLWQAILSHFDPTQILGNGLNASVVLLTNLRVSDSQGVIAFATHNLLLETLYDQGIIGVILLSLVALALFASLIAGVRKTTGAHRVLFLTALTIFGSVVLQSLASDDLMNPAIAVYFWVSMALPFAVCWPMPARNTPEQPPEAEVEIENFDDETTIPRTQAVGRKSSKPNFVNASSASK